MKMTERSDTLLDLTAIPIFNLVLSSLSFRIIQDSLPDFLSLLDRQAKPGRGKGSPLSPSLLTGNPNPYEALLRRVTSSFLRSGVMGHGLVRS